MVIRQCFELIYFFGKGLQHYHAVRIVEVLDGVGNSADDQSCLIFNDVSEDVQV